MRFGIHVPGRKNLPDTARYAADIGCETIQLFSGNPMGWSAGRLDPAEADAFARETADAGIHPVFLHTPYLINLATPDRRLQSLSLGALIGALRRSVDIGAGPVVVHCGNHMGAGTDSGIERAIRMLERALDDAPGEATVAVENGAGKGTEIGLTPDELGCIVRPFPDDRVGIVLDTAHLWAMGHDLSDPRCVATLVRQLDAGPGLNRVWGLHGNDSSAQLGSRRDRHALWTEGRMGRRGLRAIVGCDALSGLPFVFEIPGETAEFDRKRLTSMRRLEGRLRGGSRHLPAAGQ
ncbi:MAG: deoxyribonuclease IV [Candidatus Eisenbacteria bacterium]|nr:deoxyribonuclease IV [Candidatus Eisenbacteria bacterium]